MKVELKELIEVSKKQDYKEACERLRDLHQMKVECDAAYKAAKEEVLSLCGGDRMEYGVKIATVVTLGRIQYDLIPELMSLDKNYVDAFRAESTNTQRVTIY